MCVTVSEWTRNKVNHEVLVEASEYCDDYVQDSMTNIFWGVDAGL